MSINTFIHATFKHSKLIIILTIAVTIFMGWKAWGIRFDTNVNNLMLKQNDRIENIQSELGIEKEATNILFVSIYGDDLYNLEVLQAYQNTIDAILAIPEVEEALTPFNFIFFEAKDKRIIPITLSPTSRAPVTGQELDIFEKRMTENSLSENFVVDEHGRALTALFISSHVEDPNAFMETFNNALEPLHKVTKVYHTGEVAFQERVAYYLVKDFSKLLGLALFAMLIIFWLSFRSLQSVLLPIIVVVIGVIWSLGFMAIIGFRITVLTVIIPSLVLAIGSSYTIHILNEYYRAERDAGMTKTQWLADAVAHVIRTVIAAALTTIVSFMSLLTTTLKPLQEFGLSTSLGIFFCAILALFFLPSVLYLLKLPPKTDENRVKKGLLTKIVAQFGQWARRYRFIILGFFILLLTLFLVFYPFIQHQSDYFSYFPSDDPVINGSRFINKHSGGSQTFHITLTETSGKKNYFLDPEVLQKIDKFETVIGEHPSVTNKLSFIRILKTLNKMVNGVEEIPESRGLILLLYRYYGMVPKDKISFGQESDIIDKNASRITIYLRLSEATTYSMINEDDIRRFQDFVDEEFQASFGSAVNITVWGNTLLVLDSSRRIKQDQLRSTLISIIIGMFVTWIFFRSFIYSLMALIPLLSGIFFYFINLYVFSIPLDMTTILVTTVTVGVGLDDAVHFILQYRQQRKLQPYRLALSSTLIITGRPIVLTTLSLACGLLVLCFASFKPVVFFGLLMAGTLFSTMMGTVVFIPAAITFYEMFHTRKKTIRRKRLLLK